MTLSAVAGARVAQKRAEQFRPVLRYDPALLGAVLLLVMFGVVMVYSASAVYAGARLGDPLWFLKRQAAGALIGLAALLLTMKVGYRRLEALALALNGQPSVFPACQAILIDFDVLRAESVFEKHTSCGTA